jgi:hypothetical protein
LCASIVCTPGVLAIVTIKTVSQTAVMAQLRHHPEILTEFRAIVAATSLEESGYPRPEQPAFVE